MLFKVTIREISEAIVEVEADSHDEALEKVDEAYWQNPNDYCLEPRITEFE